MTTRPLSQSELSAFRECRRRWYLGTYLGLRARDSHGDLVGAAALGHKVHRALEAYYSPRTQFAGMDTPDRVLSVFDTWMAEEFQTKVNGRPEAVEEQWRKETALARVMLEGYFEWLEAEGADANLTVLDAERELSIPLVFDGVPVTSTAPPHEVLPLAGPDRLPGGTVLPVHIVGKIDVTVRNESTGDKGVLDHKTVGSLGEKPKMADIDEQVMHYVLLQMLEASAAGEPPDESVRTSTYNMLRKVKRTASATPPFYGRHDAHFNVDQIRGYWAQLSGIVHDLLVVEERLAAGADPLIVAYPTPSRDCEWKCAFRSLCPMMTDSRADSLGMIQGEHVPADAYERYDIVTFPQETPT